MYVVFVRDKMHCRLGITNKKTEWIYCGVASWAAVVGKELSDSAAAPVKQLPFPNPNLHSKL